MNKQNETTQVRPAGEAGQQPAARGPAPPLNPYIAGALTGVATVMALWMVEQQFGATPFYVACVRPIKVAWYWLTQPDLLEDVAFYLRVRWHFLFGIGIILGALASAWLAGDFKWQAVPNLWQRHFGKSHLRRGIMAFVGSFIAMLGVRMAGGCPSGLGLSGMVQLSLGGFVGMVFFFIGGVLMASVVYRWLYPARGNSSGGGQA